MYSFLAKYNKGKSKKDKKARELKAKADAEKKKREAYWGRTGQTAPSMDKSIISVEKLFAPEAGDEEITEEEEQEMKKLFVL